ncbi:MAG: hypothetical protein KF699_15010 [Phycisphaeraceae bacterium]|nr:hypothetical protein [Phycisphaeraceae bacterium]
MPRTPRPPHTPPAAQVGPVAARAVEAEVRGNVLAQPFGSGTVADLALPDSFVRRVADRAIIDSYNERFRVVEDDAARPAAHPRAAAAADGVRVIRGVTFGQDADGPDEQRDVPRNFGGRGAGAFGVTLAGRGAAYEARRAQEIVTRRLARDGLPATALEAVRTLGPAAAGQVDLLKAALSGVGVPTDLLAMFELPGADGFPHGDAAAWMAARVRAGDAAMAVRERLGRAVLRAVPSLAGFEPTDDAGSRVPVAARLQVTRGDDWLGEGDGGSIDVARQVAALAPDVPLFIGVQTAHAADLCAHASEWMARRSAGVTIIEEGARLSQWAQDNARPGCIGRGGKRTPAALLPRYASRHDELTAYVPGDTHAAESLSSAGFALARSPLHFQGGNLLVVEDRARRERVLLLGEAEVYRNIALGLTRDQALELFRVEFAAQRCVVVPAASYHLDYEVFVRTDADGRPVAFVASALEGARAVAGSGIAAMERAGVLPAGAAAPDRLDAVWAALGTHFDPAFGFRATVAACFSSGTVVDPGAAGLRVMLEAMDTLAAASGLDERPEVARGLNGHTLAMLAARRRTLDDRIALRSTIAELGWRVVETSAMPAGRRGVSVLNAVNCGPMVLMPFGAGNCRSAEGAAAEAVASNGCSVAGVRTAESQRRHGALRCALALHG